MFGRATPPFLLPKGIALGRLERIIYIIISIILIGVLGMVIHKNHTGGSGAPINLIERPYAVP